MASQLSIIPPDYERIKQLKNELAEALIELRKAEAIVAEEQAAVNRFRMHCRLKIGVWVDEVLRQRAERQRLLTQLELRRHSAEFDLPYDEADPYWEARQEAFPENPDEPERVLLPTDVPNDKSAEKRIYRELARRFHPDLAAAGLERAYATTMMTAVNAAYQQRDLTTLRNLAGELAPEEMAEYTRSQSVQERKLSKSLLGCHKRLRKVTQQFQAMKSENTARLWRKAQRLETDGQAWWNAVRVELEVESERLSNQIGKLKQQLEQLSSVMDAP